jgi:hypothetical protein
VATQQGGLTAYQDDDAYLKLDWEFSGGVAKLSETSETSEDSLAPGPINQGGDVIGAVFARFCRAAERRGAADQAPRPGSV